MQSNHITTDMGSPLVAPPCLGSALGWDGWDGLGGVIGLGLDI